MISPLQGIFYSGYLYYLVNYYKTNLITTDQIKQRSNFKITQDINDIIGYVMSDLSNTGYGFE